MVQHSISKSNVKIDNDRLISARAEFTRYVVDGVGRSPM